jgi:hypothetical protein
LAQRSARLVAFDNAQVISIHKIVQELWNTWVVQLTKASQLLLCHRSESGIAIGDNFDDHIATSVDIGPATNVCEGTLAQLSDVSILVHVLSNNENESDVFYVVHTKNQNQNPHHTFQNIAAARTIGIRWNLRCPCG